MAAADHQRAAELLLLSGCDVHAVDSGNATALLYAAGAPLLFLRPSSAWRMWIVRRFVHNGLQLLLESCRCAQERTTLIA